MHLNTDGTDIMEPGESGFGLQIHAIDFSQHSRTNGAHTGMKQQMYWKGM
jgi:hypothetical protein